MATPASGFVALHVLGQEHNLFEIAQVINHFSVTVATISTTSHRDTFVVCISRIIIELCAVINSFTASYENAMTLSVPGIPASCEKFPHSSQLIY
jgi:hypothetical protein